MNIWSRKYYLLSAFLFLLLGAISKAAEKTSDSLISEESRALASRAEKAFTSGDLHATESLYKQAIAGSPNIPSLLVSLAAVETRLGNFSSSDHLLQQALSLDLKNGAAWLLLGMNALAQKRDTEAFAALVQAALTDDLNPRVHNYLGIAAGRKGWNEASEQELRRAVELDPHYADANFNLAVLYLRRTPPLMELAHRHYQQALDLGCAKDPAMEAQFTNAIARPTPLPATSNALP
jgi:Flp pilus assembly protein TadD